MLQMVTLLKTNIFAPENGWDWKMKSPIGAAFQAYFEGSHSGISFTELRNSWTPMKKCLSLKRLLVVQNIVTSSTNHWSSAKILGNFMGFPWVCEF